MAGSETRRLFLGVEISTQQVKVVAVDEALNVVYEDGVKFDTDLSEFRTEGGVHIHDDQLTVTAPTLMWIKAVDVTLKRMKDTGFEFSRVAALSGTGQQHGSVFWRKGSEERLGALQPDGTMAEQLKDAFSIEDSPIWQDSSTTAQCRHLEAQLGGPKRVAEITGSRAYERFTGNQIAKIHQTNVEAYNNTERVSLVSSLGACLFTGKFAPIDMADGSGMNLLDIRTKQWSEECLKVELILQKFGLHMVLERFCATSETAPRLREKLGEPVPSHTCVGLVSSYMVDRYKFSPDCQVIAFTGDNPASVAGMQLQRGDIIISVGTSDTLFLWLDEPQPATMGHVFVNPVDPEAYMALLCYKNGSLTRERIQTAQAGGSWECYNQLLKSTPPGNHGNIGIYFDTQEITPHAVGTHRIDADDKKVASFTAEVEARAVVEGQIMAKRIHAQSLGYSLGHDSRVLATGGASSNKAILQIIADVFNAPVYTQDVANSACLGSAYRAKHGLQGGDKMSFADAVKGAPDLVCSAMPDSDASQVYTALCKRYQEFENRIVAEQTPA